MRLKIINPKCISYLALQFDKHALKILDKEFIKLEETGYLKEYLEIIDFQRKTGQPASFASPIEKYDVRVTIKKLGDWAEMDTRIQKSPQNNSHLIITMIQNENEFTEGYLTHLPKTSIF